MLANVVVVLTVLMVTTSGAPAFDMVPPDGSGAGRAHGDGQQQRFVLPAIPWTTDKFLGVARGKS